VNYSKYKFKRNNIAQSALLGISYSIGATGKYTPTLEYEAVLINDKRYRQAKMAVKRIQDFGQLYVGQPCDVELKADINPMVVAVYDPPSTDEPIQLIRKCLHCRKILQYNENKQGDVVISCVNPNCPGVIRQRIIKFLNAIKYKGISEKTLLNDNITDINSVLFKKPIKEHLKGLTVVDIYIGCSLCTQTTAKKVVPDTSLTIRDWNTIREDLLRNHGDDVFVRQVIKFIDHEVRTI
jgi:DNA ligase (NAD+)